MKKELSLLKCTITGHKLAFSFGLCPSSLLLIIMRPNLLFGAYVQVPLLQE